MESLSEEPNYTPRLYHSRWLMLFLFCLLSLVNGAQWSNFSTISDIVQDYYNVDPFAVNCLSMVYFGIYGVFVFVSIWILEKYGLRKNLIAGAVLNAIGAILKCAAVNKSGYVTLFCGQTFAAFAQCFILGIPAHIAAIWFGEHERAVITAVGVFANQVGVAVGFSISAVLVPNTTLQEIEKGFLILFVAQGGFSTLIALLIAVFFKEKPLTPPSFSQINQYKSETEPKNSIIIFCSTMFELMRNPSYMFLLFGYGTYVALSFTLMTLINEVIQPQYPGQNTFSGSLSFVYIISGLPGAIIAGIWLERTKSYKCTLLTAAASTTIIYAIFSVILQRFKSHVLLYIILGLLGFTGTAVFPVGFEFAAEITYPVQEGISSGFLNCSAQTLAIVFVALGTYLISLENIGIDVMNGIFTGLLALSSFLISFVKTDLKRSTADRYKAVVDVEE